MWYCSSQGIVVTLDRIAILPISYMWSGPPIRDPEGTDLFLNDSFSERGISLFYLGCIDLCPHQCHLISMTFV